jgi:hypothetical protein
MSKPARFTRSAVRAFALLLVASAATEAAPVAVRAPEGPTYALLTLRSTGGERLADGELIQRVRDGNVESRLLFHFEDGSSYDEIVVFSQDRVFRVLSYSLVQKGPSFASSLDVSFDRETGRYRARSRESGDDEDETADGEVEIPEDVYNGMGGVLMRNTDGRASGYQLAFTPKPHLLTMKIAPAGTDHFSVGRTRREADRYLMKFEIGGITGLIAKLIGKSPPEVYYWFADPAPGFLKFEGPMYLGGPVWRIEPAPARWE